MLREYEVKPYSGRYTEGISKPIWQCYALNINGRREKWGNAKEIKEHLKRYRDISCVMEVVSFIRYTDAELISINVTMQFVSYHLNAA